MWDSELFKYIVATLLAPILAALTTILTSRLSKSKREQEGEAKSLDAKTEFDISQSADAIANGSKVAIENLLRSVEFMRQEVDTHRELRILRDKEISELKERIQKDTEETRGLRNDYALAQKRIINLEDMIIKVSEYADTLKTSMQKAEIPVPLNGELMESVHRLKMEIALRNK